jgi:hypothetical protein
MLRKLAFFSLIFFTLNSNSYAGTVTLVERVLVASNGDVSLYFSDPVAQSGICRGNEIPDTLVTKNLFSQYSTAAKAQLSVAMTAQVTQSRVLVEPAGVCGSSNVEELNFIILEKN